MACKLLLYSFVISRLRSWGASLFITIFATALPTAPIPAAIAPDFNCSAVSDFIAAHSAASSPPVFVNARETDAYAPSVMPMDSLLYKLCCVASKIVSDSIPGGNPNDSLRIFISAAKSIYSVRNVSKVFAPGNVIFVSPP